MTPNLITALEMAIQAMNATPSFGTGIEEFRNSYKLIPHLEKALAKGREDAAALRKIAETPLWGEPIADDDLKQEYAEAAEYDLEADEFNPSGDTESTHLRDAVEGVRGVLGMPYTVEKQEAANDKAE